VANIPTDGSAVCVRLWTQINGAWQFRDYVYMAATLTVSAAITSPAANSTLSGASVTFQWNAGTGATAYEIYVATHVGWTDIATQSLDDALPISITNIPTNGTAVCVRLWTQINGAWQFRDYVYMSATLTVSAAITSPAANSTLSGASVTFQWNAGT